MATWRQALEVVMTRLRVCEPFHDLAPSRRAGCSVLRCFWLIAETHRFLPSDSGLACIIRRSNAASNGRWPLGR
jgi:hypothetical protein